MVSYPTPSSFKFNTFKGIRTRNGIAQGGTISATECKNVDFVPSAYDAGVIIRSSYGNYPICEYTGFKIIKGFEFKSENSVHLLFYCENDTYGKLVEFTGTVGNPFTDIIDTYTDDNNDTQHYFEVTGQANGITMLDNAYNTFVFTNGLVYFAYCPDAESADDVVKKLEPEYNSSPVTGLALAEQDGSIVIGCNEGVVLASRKGDITDFDYVTPEDTNKAWYQLFGKAVTAVVPYIDALLVFTEEDSTMLSGNMSDASSATRADASLGGCMSFESWVKHDKYLFFYDNRQKNIYYYMQNDYGQKVLGEPIAPEVQVFFNKVSRLQMVSYIGNNRSEIWVLLDDKKLIYDYFMHEWAERDCQTLTSYFVYDNNVYSTGGAKVLKEKAGNMGLFDGVYYPSVYKMQIINLGSYSNMKEMEFQPLLTVESNYNNTFALECLINGKKTKTKYLEMFFQGAIWADNTAQTEETPESEVWAEDGEDEEDQNVIGQVFPDENDALIQQLKGKFISNWYFLQFTIRTQSQGDSFSINCFELKGITEEYDTVGVK